MAVAIVDDALIIGAGPAGLCTAAALARLGARVRLVDRTGVPGGAYARMAPTIQITSPAAIVALPGLAIAADERDRGDYLTAAAYHRYLARYAEHHRLTIEPAAIAGVDRGVGRTWRARTATGDTYAARAVAIATGMFDFPKRPEVAGLPPDGDATADRPAVLHASAWRDDDRFRDRRVLVVGAGSSGIEIAEAESRRARTVIVSARRAVRTHPQTIAGVDPARVAFPFLARTPGWLGEGAYCRGDRNGHGIDHGFARLRRGGQVAVRAGLRRVVGRIAELDDGSTVEVDAIILATGYRHAAPLLPPDTARHPGGVPIARHGRSPSHHDLWLPGHPCARTLASQYLYGMAHDAAAIARAIART